MDYQLLTGYRVSLKTSDVKICMNPLSVWNIPSYTNCIFHLVETSKMFVSTADPVI